MRTNIRGLATLVVIVGTTISSCNPDSDFSGQSAEVKKKPSGSQNGHQDGSSNQDGSPGSGNDTLVPEGMGQDCAIVKNLIKNPDFETGNSGFTSNFTFDPSCKGTYSPHPALHFSVNDSVQRCHNGYASLAGDRGKMLVVNFPAAGQAITKFWCQDIEVTAGRQYKIAARVRAAVPSVVTSQPTSVAFTANGKGFTANGKELIPEFRLEADWKEYTAVLSPMSSGTITFCGEARTQNTESTDLVMDDVVFGECKIN